MSNKPSEVEVLDAVRKLILWAGDDPDREGLIETPKRVAKAYKEFFSGYHDDPVEILNKTFENYLNSSLRFNVIMEKRWVKE